MKNPVIRHSILLAILFTIAFLLGRNSIPSGLYGYDEADYMFATSLGLEQNWLDAGTIPITEYVREGLKRGPQASQQASLSEFARKFSDPVFYRHERGPLFFYWLTIPLRLGLDEHGVRALSMIFPILTALVMYFGSLVILGGVEGQAAAIISSALFLWSPVTLETMDLAPHTLFVFLYVCALLLLAKAQAGGGRRYFYAAVACTGLAYATMEVAFVLVLVLPIFAWWWRESLHSDRYLARNSAGLFLAVVLATWPASLFKLSFVKIYLVMAYLAIFRKNAWGATFGETWIDRFTTSPAEWLLLICAIVLLAFAGKERLRSPGVVFLSFAVLMILATLRLHAQGPRNSKPFWAALEVFIAWTLASAVARLARPWPRYGTIAAICGLLVWNTQYQMSGKSLRGDSDTNPHALLDTLHADGMAKKTLLAPRDSLPTLHYYFPQMHVRGYSNESELAAESSDGQFDAVLLPDNSIKLAPVGFHP